MSVVFKPASAGTIKNKKGLGLSYPAQKGTHYIELEGRGSRAYIDSNCNADGYAYRCGDSHGDFDRDANADRNRRRHSETNRDGNSDRNSYHHSDSNGYVDRANGNAYPFAGRAPDRGWRSRRQAWRNG